MMYMAYVHQKYCSLFFLGDGGERGEGKRGVRQHVAYRDARAAASPLRTGLDVQMALQLRDVHAKSKPKAL